MTAFNTFTYSARAFGVAPAKRGARRVLVIDNHPIVRAGLRRVIDAEDDLLVCAEADTARDARTAIKERNPDAIVADIGLNQVDGDIYVSDEVGLNMLRKSTGPGVYMSSNPIDRLSNRELQVLHLVGRGLSTKQTARALNLSVKTIESHRQRIKHKLKLTTGTQLVQYAINWFTGQEAGVNSNSQPLINYPP